MVVIKPILFFSTKIFTKMTYIFPFQLLQKNKMLHHLPLHMISILQTSFSSIQVKFFLVHIFKCHGVLNGRHLTLFLKTTAHTTVVSIHAWKRPKKGLKKASQTHTTLNTGITYDNFLSAHKTQATFHFKDNYNKRPMCPIITKKIILDF